MDLYSEKMEFSSEYSKLKVKFKSQRKYLYTGWEINQITHSINVAYYKNELLNSIKSLLSDNTDPKNIFILNSSVKVGSVYNYIQDRKLELKKSQDIINLYYMGSPIALVPSKGTVQLYELFEFYREFYKKCKSFGLTPPNRRLVTTAFVKEPDFFSNIINLKKYLLERVNEINEPSFTEDEELLSKVNKLFKSIDKKLDNLLVSMDEAELLDKFHLEAEKDIQVKLESDQYKGLKKHFNSFTTTFNSLDRPFVCVYNPETEILDVLCTDLISLENFTEDNYRFFETKLITQNSPLELIISVGIGFAPSLIKIGEAIINSRRTIKLAKTEELERFNEMNFLDEEINNIEGDIKGVQNEIEALNMEIQNLDQEIQKIEEETVNNPVVVEATNIVEECKNTSDNNVESDYSNQIVEELIYSNNGNVYKTLNDKHINLESVDTEAS